MTIYDDLYSKAAGIYWFNAEPISVHATLRIYHNDLTPAEISIFSVSSQAKAGKEATLCTGSVVFVDNAHSVHGS